MNKHINNIPNQGNSNKSDSKTYTVKQLADLSHISVRTLHYYDEIDILKPNTVKQNGYREYGQNELLRLQQILLFKEIELPLEKIKEILDDPDFDYETAMVKHKEILSSKLERLKQILSTIDATTINIKKIKNKTQENMNKNSKSSMSPISSKDDENRALFDAFESEEQKAYQKEAEERWGNTLAWKQSQVRYAKLTQEDKIRIQKAADDLMREMADCMKKGNTPESKEMQKLVVRHYEGLRTFYDPSPELYRGLADMYIADPRFTAYYEAYAPGLAEYLSKAMHVYTESLR